MKPGSMVRGATHLAKGRFQACPNLPCSANAGLRHEQPKTGWSGPNRPIRGTCFRADHLRQFVGDGVRRSRIGCSADLEEQDRRRSAIPRVARGFVAEGGRPVRARVELAWGIVRIRARTRYFRTAGSVEERLDPFIGSRVVLIFWVDETTGSAWCSFGRGGKVVSRVSHAHQVYPARPERARRVRRQPPAASRIAAFFARLPA